MSRERAGRQRAFQPALDGWLESRFLLSAGRIHAQAVHVAPISGQRLNGGRSILITDGDGQQFEVTLTSILQPTVGPQISQGTIRARALPGGRVALIADGTTQDTELAINPVINHPAKHTAHKFSAGLKFDDHLLHVGSITVTSGKINSILGYRSADLSGPLVVGGDTPVNRIAFASILPGASIHVGGDLATLDVLNDLTLDGGPGLVVGRDLDWIDVGGNMTLLNGASVLINRDLGFFAQAAKGTAPGGQGGLVTGDLVIGPGSAIIIGRSLDAPFVVEGNGFGVSRIAAGFPNSTFVFRPGAIVLP